MDFYESLFGFKSPLSSPRWAVISFTVGENDSGHDERKAFFSLVDVNKIY